MGTTQTAETAADWAAASHLVCSRQRGGSCARTRAGGGVFGSEARQFVPRHVRGSAFLRPWLCIRRTWLDRRPGVTAVETIFRSSGRGEPARHQPSLRLRALPPATSGLLLPARFTHCRRTRSDLCAASRRSRWGGHAIQPATPRHGGHLQIEEAGPEMGPRSPTLNELSNNPTTLGFGRLNASTAL